MSNDVMLMEKLIGRLLSPPPGWLPRAPAPARARREPAVSHQLWLWSLAEFDSSPFSTEQEFRCEIQPINSPPRVTLSVPGDKGKGGRAHLPSRPRLSPLHQERAGGAGPGSPAPIPHAAGICLIVSAPSFPREPRGHPMCRNAPWEPEGGPGDIRLAPTLFLLWVGLPLVSPRRTRTQLSVQGQGRHPCWLTPLSARLKAKKPEGHQIRAQNTITSGSSPPPRSCVALQRESGLASPIPGRCRPQPGWGGRTVSAAQG